MHSGQTSPTAPTFYHKGFLTRVSKCPLLVVQHLVRTRCTMAERPTLLSWRSHDARAARAAHKKRASLAASPVASRRVGLKVALAKPAQFPSVLVKDCHALAGNNQTDNHMAAPLNGTAKIMGEPIHCIYSDRGKGQPYGWPQGFNLLRTGQRSLAPAVQSRAHWTAWPRTLWLRPLPLA